MFLVFDTETTGLPPYAPTIGGRRSFQPVEEVEKWNDCRLVQLAWMVCSEDGTIIKTRDYIIRPKYFIIPEEVTKIHGITQERAKKEGTKIEIVLREFLEDLRTISTIVAHNIAFDYHVVSAELCRLGMALPIEAWPTQYCTMKNGCRPNEKWPKLSELYEKYFHQKPTLTLHQALNDVALCRDVYLRQINSCKNVTKEDPL